MNQKLTGFVYGVDASSMFSQAMSLLQKGLIAVGAAGAFVTQITI
ncbi:TPA: hypothetical protein ACMUN4_001462 [Streptococcus agalactiae]|nr:hypothetical protein [Streptococcus agalactiae]EPU82673.1 hypothetical protein SAG0316_00745 [Streptococcus agalactiae GB00206]